MIGCKFIFSNLYRNRGRYLLFGLLFLVLSAVWLVCLLLGHASAALQIDLIEKFGTVAVVRQQGEGNKMTEEIYEHFAVPELVKEVVYTTHIETPVMCNIAPKKSENGTEGSHYRTGDVSIVGFNFDCAYTPFTKTGGAWKLTRGRLIEADDECIITDDMYDGLVEKGIISGLGDQLLIISYDVTPEEVIAWKLEGNQHAEHFLKIVGTVDRTTLDFIYRSEIKLENDDEESYVLLGNSFPLIFTSIEMAKQFPRRDSMMHRSFLAKYYLSSRIEAVYILHDHTMFDAFASMVQKDNDSRLLELVKNPNRTVRLDPSLQYYDAKLYVDGFENMIEPLGKIEQMTEMMTANLFLLAAALLIILTVLNLYARTYEIGVLRCIGMAKVRIAIDLMIEHGMFILGSLGAGLLCGTLVAYKIIPLMLDQKYRSYLTDQLIGLPESIGTILLMGVVLTAVASLLAVIYIQRYRPLKILRNRN